MTSNLSFFEWGSTTIDPRLVAAVIDRVAFNADIIETGPESSRLRTSAASRSAAVSGEVIPNPLRSRSNA